MKRTVGAAVTQQTPEPLLFENMEAAHSWVAAVYDAAWRASLTAEQVAALTTIKSGAYAAINAYLRTGRAGRLPSRRTVQRWIDDASAGLCVKPLPVAVTVFRGLSFRVMFGEAPSADLVSGVVQDRAFVSTTLWLPAALRFGAEVLAITAPEGTPAAWLDVFEQRGELEILLQPGTKLQIEGSESESGRRIILVRVVG